MINDWLLNPIEFFADPSRRLFFGFLLSSMLIIFISSFINKKKWSRQRFRLIFLSPKYWLTRSTCIDLSFLLGNTALRTLLIIPLFGSHLVGAIWVARTLQSHFDTPPNLALPWIVIASLFTLTFFITEDLSRFLLHKLMHSNAFLWRIHTTHHSAETLTPLTLHRVHPIEMALYYTRGFIVFSLVSGVFIYFSGKRLSALDILGVDALGFLFNMLGANLRHSHIWISFGKLEKWFISPAQHQIHHSNNPAHFDKNFGSALSIWDRLSGSWVPATHYQKLRFGVNHPLKKTRITHAIWRTFKKRLRFKDKIINVAKIS